MSIEMVWPSRSTPTRHGGQVVGVVPSLNLPALNVRWHSSHSTNVSRGLDDTPALYTCAGEALTVGAISTVGFDWRRA